MTHPELKIGTNRIKAGTFLYFTTVPALNMRMAR
jgi:hypothetical protein